MMFARQLSRFFNSVPHLVEVKIGEVFETILDGNVIETAKVVGVGPDSLGIPHVHFEVQIKKSNLKCVEENRTLGLETFNRRYSKCVAA